MEIVIGFSRAKDPWKIGSKIIAESEKRDFSHAYVRVTDPFTGVELVYQASLGMVNAYNYELFKDHNVVVEEYAIECSEEQFKSIMIFLQKNLGKPYSKAQILFLSIKKLLRFEVKYNNKDAEFICSELAFRILMIILPAIVIENLDFKTPSDLNTMIKNLGLRRIYGTFN